MQTTRIVFTSTTTSDIKFVNSDITFDGGMAVVWQGAAKVFAVPVSSLVAVEKIATVAEAPDPEPMPVAAEDGP